MGKIGFTVLVTEDEKEFLLYLHVALIASALVHCSGQSQQQHQDKLHGVEVGYMHAL